MGAVRTKKNRQFGAIFADGPDPKDKSVDGYEKVMTYRSQGPRCVVNATLCTVSPRQFTRVMLE